MCLESKLLVLFTNVADPACCSRSPHHGLSGYKEDQLYVTGDVSTAVVSLLQELSYIHITGSRGVQALFI